MSDLHVTLNGLPVEKATIYEPQKGPWFADIDLVKDLAPTGKATLKVGSTTFVGTVDSSASGDFGGRGRVRLVAGGNGWNKLAVRKPYSSDVGVRASEIAADIATEVGETIGSFQPQRQKIGNHYARAAGPAGRVLEDAIGSAGWWVDRAGVTQIGARSASAVAAGAVSGIQGFDARQKQLSLTVDDLSLVQVGQTVSTPLAPAALTISTLEIRITPEAIKLTAWCGDETRNEVADLLSAIARRATETHLWGVYEYRVVDMIADRARLQATDPSLGLPDLSFIEQWPGIAGAHVTLAPASIVLVSFVNGSPTRPVITHWRDGRSESPLQIEIGKIAPAAAARQGDPVEVLLPPAVITGTALIGGTPTPITAVAMFPIAKTLGVITGGSNLVKIGQG